MANQEPKVRVEHLTKRFGDLLVLDDLNFEVQEGEFLCIVGPTGCGKTTFLNSLTRRAISWSTASRSTRKNRISRISSRNIPPSRG